MKKQLLNSLIIISTFLLWSCENKKGNSSEISDTIPTETEVLDNYKPLPLILTPKEIYAINDSDQYFIKHNGYFAVYDPTKDSLIYIPSVSEYKGCNISKIIFSKTDSSYVVMGDVYIQASTSFKFDNVSVSGNGRHFFIAKYSQNNKIMWVKVAKTHSQNRTFGASNYSSRINKALIKDNGDIIIVGSFFLNFAFDNKWVFEEVDKNFQGYVDLNCDAFVASLTKTGKLNWAKKIYSKSGYNGLDDNANILTQINNDTILIGGTVKNQPIFDGKEEKANDDRSDKGFVSLINSRGEFIQTIIINESKRTITSLVYVNESEIYFTGKTCIGKINNGKVEWIKYVSSSNRIQDFIFTSLKLFNNKLIAFGSYQEDFTYDNKKFKNAKNGVMSEAFVLVCDLQGNLMQDVLIGSSRRSEYLALSTYSGDGTTINDVFEYDNKFFLNCSINQYKKTYPDIPLNNFSDLKDAAMMVLEIND